MTRLAPGLWAAGAECLRSPVDWHQPAGWRKHFALAAHNRGAKRVEERLTSPLDHSYRGRRRGVELREDGHDIEVAAGGHAGVETQPAVAYARRLHKHSVGGAERVRPGRAEAGEGLRGAVEGDAAVLVKRGR